MESQAAHTHPKNTQVPPRGQKKVTIVEVAVSGRSTVKMKSTMVSSVSRAHFICLQTVCLTVKNVGTFLQKLVQRLVKNRLQAAGILSCAQRFVSKGNMLVCDSSFVGVPSQIAAHSFAALSLAHSTQIFELKLGRLHAV